MLVGCIAWLMLRAPIWNGVKKMLQFPHALDAVVSSSNYNDSLESHIYTVKVTYTGDKGFLWCFGVMVEHAKILVSCIFVKSLLRADLMG